MHPCLLAPCSRTCQRATEELLQTATTRLQAQEVPELAPSHTPAAQASVQATGSGLRLHP